MAQHQRESIKCRRHHPTIKMRLNSTLKEPIKDEAKENPTELDE